MTIFEKLLSKHFFRVAADINFLNQKISNRINDTSEYLQGLIYGYLKPRIDRLEEAREIKTAFTGPILLSSNINKVICTVPTEWRKLFIEWRDGSNTGWSTYLNFVVNKGGFFQFRFQGCPFALQINAQGELKCYSIDTGKEAFIRSVQWE